MARRRRSKSNSNPTTETDLSAAPDDGVAPAAIDTDAEPEEADDDKETPEEMAEAKARSRADDIWDEDKYGAEAFEVYNDVLDAFQDKNDQANDIERYWKVYNCQLTPNQYYNGTSQVYLPIVHDAIEARVQRFTATLFPQNGRYTDVTANVPNGIRAITGLLDHYVRRDRLRSRCKELLRNGEVEGQYTVYVDWSETRRFITKKVEKHPELEPGVHDTSETFMDVEDEEVVDARPTVHLISAPDLAVLPPTWDDIEVDADVVAIRRWYSKGGIERMRRQGKFSDEAAQVLMSGLDSADASVKDPRDKKLQDAGICWQGNKFVALVYEVWRRMEVEDDRRPWVQTYYAGPRIVAGMFVNPNWNDRCSVISKPRMKIDGSGWGKSPVDSVEQLQYQANDWANMAGDNGMYSLLPIVMTDPEKNPNLASMVMNLAAVWQTSPKDTQFVEMPQLWKDALSFIDASESKVLKAFGLNPAMISSGTGSRKQTQADVAQDALVAMQITVDEVTTLEDDIFTPVLQRFFELDQQHRDEPLTVKIYGQMGIDANMEAVPPFAWDDRYEISWRGSQVVQSQQANQQMIAGLNILRSLPPVLPDGKRIELSPIITTVVENIYGPRLGSQILVDVRDQMSVPPEIENQLTSLGIQALVHQGDNDIQHLQAHIADIQQNGDPSGLKAAHIQAQQEQMAKKQQAMMQQQNPQGLPGSPGAPGIAGTPRPGAQPAPPRGGQQPPGAVHQDRMQDPSRMPRKSA